MPKLTGPDMKSIREGLLLSAQALTDRLKHAGLVPVGHVRTIQRWEEGARPVPNDIADYLLELEHRVGRMAVGFNNSIFFKEREGSPLFAFLRYEDDADYPEAKEPHDHRLHAAALQRAQSAQLGMDETGMHLVRFDREAFIAWRTGHHLPDDPSSRGQWATEQARWALAHDGAPEEESVQSWAEKHAQAPNRTPHARKKGE